MLAELADATGRSREELVSTVPSDPEAVRRAVADFLASGRAQASRELLAREQQHLSDGDYAAMIQRLHYRGLREDAERLYQEARSRWPRSRSLARLASRFQP
jgi:hypothetical protein